MMAKPSPLGFSLHEFTTETISTFVCEIDDDFKYLEDILHEVKIHFGRRESNILLPKTPCKKRKRKLTRKSAEESEENTDQSSTEDEHVQDSKKKMKIEEAKSLQAICEDEVLDTSSIAEETGKRRRSKVTRKLRSQPTQPKRCTRSSRKRTLEETETVLENAYPEKVESKPRRVTRSRQKKTSANVSIIASESIAVTAVTAAVVSSTAAGRNAEGHSLICVSTNENNPKEQITATEIIADPGKVNTEPKSHDKGVPLEATEKGHVSAKDERKNVTFIPAETPEMPSQSTPCTKKIYRPETSVVLAPVADQSSNKCGEDVKVVTSTDDKESEQTPQRNEEHIVISEALVSSTQDTKKKKNVCTENSNSTVKTGQLARDSRKQVVSTTTEELGHPEEVQEDNDGNGHDTGDSECRTDNVAVVLSTVELPKEALQESNDCVKRRTRRWSRLSSKASRSRSSTRKKSTRKTPCLVKSSVTLTLTRPASKQHASKKSNSSSPAGSSDPEQHSTLSDLKQDLFGALKDTPHSGMGSGSSPSAGSTSSHSVDEQQPAVSSSGSDIETSDGVDGRGYATSQEEDGNDEDVFHDAEEELQEAAAVETKGVDVLTPSHSLRSKTSGCSEEVANSVEELESDEANELESDEAKELESDEAKELESDEANDRESDEAKELESDEAKDLESDEAKEYKSPKRQVVTAGHKDGKLSNLVAMHSFIKHTPKKIHLEDKKKRLQMVMKEKEEKEKERIEQLEILKQKELEQRKRKREEREKRVADLRAAKAKMEEDRKRKMQEKLEQKKCADEKARKRREKEEGAKRKMRQQKKAGCDARRKQDEEIRQQKLFEQEEEAKRHRELQQRKQEFEEQERQKKIVEMKRHHEFREQELDRERELEKLRRLKEVEEKKALEKEERERKAKEEEREKLEKERVRITKLIREKEAQERAEKERLNSDKKVREAREAARKLQEEFRLREVAEKLRKAAEEARKAAASVDTYEMTPPPPPRPRPKKPVSMENYDISDIHSDDSTDDEEAPRKRIPPWAQGNALWAALLNQQVSAINVDEIFGSVCPPNLEDIFKHKRKRFYQRTSSACWDSPPLKIQVHVSHV